MYPSNTLRSSLFISVPMYLITERNQVSFKMATTTIEKTPTKGRDAIVALFDPGTFVEMGAYIRRDGENAPYTAVLCGYGSVDGKLAFAFAQDTDRTSGALDAVGARKIERLYEEAIRVGAPVIAVLDSAGAIIHDGAEALAAYGRVLRCVSNASGIIPQIAVIGGICSGLSAVIASMYDVTVTVKGESDVSFHPVSSKEEDTTATAESCGLSAINADDRDGAIRATRDLIALLPRNNRDVADIEPPDSLTRPVTANELTGIALIKAVADRGRAGRRNVISLYDGFSPEIVTALCTVGGRLCGMVASDSSEHDGKLTPKGARKAARFVSFCDSFSIPVVTLVDSMGVDTSAPREPAPAFGKLAKAYITATTAKVTVVVGNAVGAAFTLLGSRAMGADLTLAIPEAMISPILPSIAVAFLWNDKITKDNPRAAVEAEWMQTEASPVRAAESGEIDDIIAPSELRARIASALFMLAEKADGTPDRKHGVPTL